MARSLIIREKIKQQSVHYAIAAAGIDNSLQV
jgi:hypothetical protein